MDNPLALLEEFLTPEALAAVERSAEGVPELPKVIALGELQTPEYGNDPSELIKCRFLYRKGILLIIGPTGIGKSSFIMQFIIYLAVGKSLFGIAVGEIYQESGMRILLIQAENDDFDLAEMRDGVLMGCKELTTDDITRAQERILTVTITDQTGPEFARTLEGLLKTEGPFDLVVVDPAFAYIAGDSNSNQDVKAFMRNQINPILHRQDVGMILVHHTNKPLRGREKEGWAGSDYAYLGSGAAEWINPCRAALAIRSLGSDFVFELRAAKRGRRLGWRDAACVPTNHQYIAHHGEPGVICWRSATDAEIVTVKPETPGRVKKAPWPEILNLIRLRPGKNQSWYIHHGMAQFSCTSGTIQNRITEMEADRLVKPKIVGSHKLYFPTEKGTEALDNECPNVDWSSIPEGKEE